MRFGKRHREDKGVSKDEPETHSEAIAGGKALGIGEEKRISKLLAYHSLAAFLRFPHMAIFPATAGTTTIRGTCQCWF